MDPEQIQQYIQTEVAKQLKARNNSDQDIPNHVHNGIDAPRIPFPKNVLGTVLTAAIPSGYGKDGDIIITDIAGTRKINGRTAGVWYGVAIT